MGFQVIPYTDQIADIAAKVLAWCGVNDPTPADQELAELAAQAAVDVFRSYNQVDAGGYVPEERVSLAVEIAVYLYKQRDDIGVVQYSENGVAVAFETGSIPSSMLRRIAPRPRWYA